MHVPVGFYNQTFLLDTTVSAIHCESNFKNNACFKKIGDKEVDRHQGGVADKAESNKNLLYSPYAHVESGLKDDKKVETMKHIVPFALDSRGGIGMDALDFVRKVYGKQVPGGPVRKWKSDKMRTNLRNQFMDKLSCLMARHRALDYTYMGIPCASREDGFEPTPSTDQVYHRGEKKKQAKSKTKDKTNKNSPGVHKHRNSIAIVN